jgi:hypothetical protein
MYVISTEEHRYCTVTRVYAEKQKKDRKREKKWMSGRNNFGRSGIYNFSNLWKVGKVTAGKSLKS